MSTKTEPKPFDLLTAAKGKYKLLLDESWGDAKLTGETRDWYWIIPCKGYQGCKKHPIWDVENYKGPFLDRDYIPGLHASGTHIYVHGEHTLAAYTNRPSKIGPLAALGRVKQDGVTVVFDPILLDEVCGLLEAKRVRIGRVGAAEHLRGYQFHASDDQNSDL